MAVAIKLVVEILAWLLKPVTPRVEEGAGSGELEKGLRKKIKREGW